MHCRLIKLLLDKIVRKYGDFQYYGSNSEELNGVGFTVNDLDVTFSVVWEPKKGLYDVQIESVPPGDYIYLGQFSLDDFLTAMDLYSTPESDWP